MPAPTPNPTLLDDIEAFLVAHPMVESTFGMKAVSAPSFVETLRAGRKPGLRIELRARDFMERAARAGAGRIRVPEAPTSADNNDARRAAEQGSAALLRAYVSYAQRHHPDSDLAQLVVA